MTLTLNLPDEYAAFLPSGEAELAEVLSAGLRRRQGQRNGEIQELDDVVEILATLPAPEEVMAIHPSAELIQRTSDLLEKNRNDALTGAERAEFNEIMRVEHLVRIAKAKAMAKLKAA
jgi:hypothetical protein